MPDTPPPRYPELKYMDPARHHTRGFTVAGGGWAIEQALMGDTMTSHIDALAGALEIDAFLGGAK